VRTIRCNADEFHHVARPLVAQGTSFLLCVYGASMYPTIRDGDIVQVRPVEPGEIGIGDIFLFRNSGRLFVHRLVAKSRQGDALLLVAKGDANPRPDKQVESGDVLGKIVEVRRRRHRRDLEKGNRHRIESLLFVRFPLLGSRLAALSRTVRRRI
jgi:phage repressor protein C with HTH and peptisase S24 domain